MTLQITTTVEGMRPEHRKSHLEHRLRTISELLGKINHDKKVANIHEGGVHIVLAFNEHELRWESGKS